MSRAGYGSNIIMNINSGPGEVASPDVERDISYCRDQGQNVLGYVHTSYGERPLSEVTADIDAWYGRYRSVDGIFVDQVASDPAALVSDGLTVKRYYKSIYRYIHAKALGADVVAIPGITPATDWLLDSSATDEMVNFEGSCTDYLAWTPPSWVADYSASDFAHLVYDCPAEQRDAAVAHSQATNAGWRYITDATFEGMPWRTLASYFTDHS